MHDVLEASCEIYFSSLWHFHMGFSGWKSAAGYAIAWCKIFELKIVATEQEKQSQDSITLSENDNSAKKKI